jgi:hypothetical protein
MAESEEDTVVETLVRKIQESNVGESHLQTSNCAK